MMGALNHNERFCIIYSQITIPDFNSASSGVLQSAENYSLPPKPLDRRKQEPEAILLNLYLTAHYHI